MFPNENIFAFGTSSLSLSVVGLLGNTPGGAGFRFLAALFAPATPPATVCFCERFGVDGSAARSPMRGTSSSSVRSAASVPATKLRPTTPSAAPTYRPKVATRSPSPPPPARGTNREDLPRRPREAKAPPADAVGTGTNPTLGARPARGSAALARTLTIRARGGDPRAEIDRSRSRPPMATNSRFTPKHGRFRESRARGRGAAPRATAPGTLIADAIARAPLVFGAVRGSGRTREAVWQSPARIATSRPCHAFSAGFYLQRPIARLNAQSSCQRGIAVANHQR